MKNNQSGYKSGFVSIVGRTNVGKSTLLNKALGQKVAIMSDKPQTTRHKISLVLSGDHAQIIFLDTPGIHKPQHKLGQHLVDVALGSLREVDVVLFMVEAFPPGSGDKYVLKRLKELNGPVILVINKIDLVNKEQLAKVIDFWWQEHHFDEVFPVSALNGENVQSLVEKIIEYLPEGPQYYPDDMITDKPERFIMAELIREKVLHLTSQEIPHSISVMVDEVKKRSDDLVLVNATVFVERDSQKRIIIGKGGSMLKQVGQLARKEIELLLGSRIYLDIWVKVKKDWRNHDGLLRTLGYYEDS
ncbi:MAG: GTPase Era [Firmicutes bacterium]|nr:GTPase Era [Bacillota bacterium]